MSDSATLWTAAFETPLFFTVSWSLLKLMFIELVILSNHLILCCPLLLLPSIFPSIRRMPMDKLRKEVDALHPQGKVIGNLFPVDPKSKMRIAWKLRKETGPFPTTYFSFSKS